MTGSAGFTLVELMIAVAILAIVAAVALPLYNQYSQRTYRTEAQADLLNCAQAMERFAAQNFTYDGVDDAALDNMCDQRSEAQNRYQITVAVPDDDQFTLTATPVAGGVMDGDGAMTYDEAGNRMWNGNPGWEE
ncbi:MAG: prepilin-type N-terminal cleavage/methylation domain-containing protein [Gammaproteobacteria bacterium]|jgi:type IV pilus assembly protein PilE|nr:prepilin-type N-terminal cleavage/methylation domain-containing protein [Gammaproteobacteria bacterium]